MRRLAQIDSVRQFWPKVGTRGRDMAKKVSKQPARRQRGAAHKVVVLVYPQIDMLDLAAPLEVFHLANLSLSHVEPQRPAYDVTLIGLGSSELIQTGCGVPVAVPQSIESFRGSVDTLIVPGGEKWDFQEDAELMKRFLRVTDRSSRIASICTGAFLLADAGLLSGISATTHWRACGMLQDRYPDIDVQEDALFVQQGDIFTSAGSTAGIDLMLHLVQQDHGREIAMRVARDLVVFLHRPGGQSQFSETLRHQSTATGAIADLLPWLANHLAGDLRVEILADRCHMSLRNFVRQFPKVTGRTPAKYVESLRVEAVKRQLEQSTESLDEIATLVGFGSADAMRRSFQRITGVSPSQYAMTFGMTQNGG